MTPDILNDYPILRCPHCGRVQVEPDDIQRQAEEDAAWQEREQCQG